jgi:hypothetical protein
MINDCQAEHHEPKDPEGQGHDRDRCFRAHVTRSRSGETNASDARPNPLSFDAWPCGFPCLCPEPSLYREQFRRGKRRRQTIGEGERWLPIHGRALAAPASHAYCDGGAWRNWMPQFFITDACSSACIVPFRRASSAAAWPSPPTRNAAGQKTTIATPVAI